jgi:hypothetical protein
VAQDGAVRGSRLVIQPVTKVSHSVCAGCSVALQKCHTQKGAHG